MLDRPRDLARRGEGADADGDGSDLADGKGGHEPLRTVGEKDGDAIAFADAHREECAREIVRARPQRAVGEPLIAEDHRLGVGMRARLVVEQAAECHARPRAAQSVTGSETSVRNRARRPRTTAPAARTPGKRAVSRPIATRPSMRASHMPAHAWMPVMNARWRLGARPRSSRS